MEGKDRIMGHRTAVVRISGLILSAFTIFTLISVLSYFFTWKADFSLLSDPEMIDRSTDVSNAGGKYGYLWAKVLVDRWFGLGALAFIVMMAVLCVRMVAGRQKYSVIRALILAFFGTVLVSWILAWAGDLFGTDTSFGGGLGGECGFFVASWLNNLVGRIVTFFILALCAALWMFFGSRRFHEWLVRDKMPVAKADEPDDDRPADSVAPSADDEVRTRNTGRRNVVTAPVEAEETPEEPVTEVPDLEEVAMSQTPAVTKPSVEEPADEGKDTGIEIVTSDDLKAEVTKELPRINVRDELGWYKFPSLDLLSDMTESIHDVSKDELDRNNIKIRSTLKTFSMDVDKVTAIVGPTVTLYKVFPAPGVRIAQIKNRQEDIAMALNSRGVRIVNLEDSVGIEVANEKPSIVPLKKILNDEAFRESKAELPVALGYTITQKVKVFDLTDAPHLLVAGATKQGKSVGLNVLITSLLYAKHPSELKFVFIDPKMVEFTAYANLLHHYLAVLPSNSEEEEKANAIVKKSDKAAKVLQSLCLEMDNRYELLSMATVNDVKLYNEKFKSRRLNPNNGHRYLPYIVAVIDEYADLAMSGGYSPEAKKDQRVISDSIVRLAQKGRAAGIHVVIATQRPSVNVITGIIKANFPCRIAFRTQSAIDSKTILDSVGAEKLIGRGDMLYYAGIETERVQCAFIKNDEIVKIAEFVGSQTGYKKSYGTPYYLPEPEAEAGGGLLDMSDLDERFMEAAEMVVTTQHGSTSDLQRRLGMGYAKAGRVMDQLQAAGIVGPQEGSKPRQILVKDLTELHELLDHFTNA